VQNELPSQGPAYPIESVDNALRMLWYLREHPSVTVSAASAHLGVARSTAHRLLAMLQHHGFVRQSAGSKTYVPGRALLEIGLAAVGNLDLRNVARPEIERLSLQVRETVHLIVLEGTATLVIDSVESPETLRVSARTGGSLPPHCTASGKVLLAELSPGELRDVVGPDPLERLTPDSIGTLAELEAELARVRECGYATNMGENEPGIVSVAVRIPVPGERPAALAIAAPSTRMSDERIPVAAAEARAAAARIAARMEGRPAEPSQAAV
jgi:DNA-binding IclR family transcriptional regulator